MLHLQPAERDVRGYLGEPVDEEQTVRVVLENQALETEEEGGCSSMKRSSDSALLL